MHEWTSSESLRTHMECVAACMRALSERLEPGQGDRWTVCGLLHDYDYERHPSAEEHPYVGVQELERRGVDGEIREAILGHAEYTGTPRRTPMAKGLFAVDELSGLIVACAKVRPEGIASLEPRSVRKKLKDRSFAAAVSREDIARGIDELSPLMGEGYAPDDHIALCIDAIRSEAQRLGL